jgi:hypothetical protein
MSHSTNKRSVPREMSDATGPGISAIPIAISRRRYQSAVEHAASVDGLEKRP